MWLRTITRRSAPMPGSPPAAGARNSDPTEKLVMEPSTSSISDGGMVSPIAALAASTATDLFRIAIARNGIFIHAANRRDVGGL